MNSGMLFIRENKINTMEELAERASSESATYDELDVRLKAVEKNCRIQLF